MPKLDPRPMGGGGAAAFFDSWAFPVTLALGVGAFALGVGALIHQGEPAPYTLSAREWACAESHQVRSVAIVPAGKTVIPVAQVRTECDAYRRVGR